MGIKNIDDLYPEDELIGDTTEDGAVYIADDQDEEREGSKSDVDQG